MCEYEIPCTMLNFKIKQHDGQITKKFTHQVKKNIYLQTRKHEENNSVMFNL